MVRRRSKRANFSSRAPTPIFSETKLNYGFCKKVFVGDAKVDKMAKKRYNFLYLESERRPSKKTRFRAFSFRASASSFLFGENTMNQKFALLIDGGFLRSRLRDMPCGAESSAVCNFIECMIRHEEFRHLSLYRAFYYDAPPFEGVRNKPLRGGKEDLGKNAVAQAHAGFIRDLRRFPHVAVRLGKTAFRGWRIKPYVLKNSAAEAAITAPDLKPDIQQKGVDMRIGLDIAALSLKKFVDAVVLVSGDSDFVPVLKFARTEGRQTFLFTLGRPIKEELRAHSDVCIESAAGDIIAE